MKTQPLAILCVVLVGIVLAFASQVSNLKLELSTTKSVLNELQNEFPNSTSYQHFSVNNDEPGKLNIVNPQFGYKATYPNNGYNLFVYSWSDVWINSANNQDAFLHIRSAKRNDPFSIKSNEDPLGYPTDHACDVSDAMIDAKPAKKYSCGDGFSYTSYIVELGDYHYSIRVSAEAKDKAATEELLNGFKFN